MKYYTKKNFQTRKTNKNKNKKNITKKYKKHKKNILKKGSKRETLMKARNLFASVEEHTLL